MRLLWRGFKWTLLALLAAVLALVAVNAFDEDLRPEVKAALQPPSETVPAQDNLFYALLGFQAPSGDLVQAGIARWRLLEQLPPVGTHAEEAAHQQRRHAEELPGALRFQGDARALDDIAAVGDALAALRAGRLDAQTMIAANAELLARYRGLRRYGGYANLFTPRAELLSRAPYFDISRTRRLWMLSLATMIARGETDAAVRELRDDTLFWRRMLAQRENHLIDKMVLVANVQRGLRSASDLLHGGNLNADQRRVLAELAGPMTPAERSMDGPLGNELRFIDNTLRDEMRRTGGVNWFDTYPPRREEDAWPPFLQRALNRAGAYFLQPRATTNLHHAGLQRVAQANGRDCRRFGEDEEALSAAAEPDWWRLGYNPVGKVLLAISGNGAMYHSYTGRLCDLMGFQRLLALQLHLRERGITSQTPRPQIETAITQAGDAYADPFTGGPMLWSPEQRGIAFGAFDARNRKMLPWPL